MNDSLGTCLTQEYARVRKASPLAARLLSLLWAQGVPWKGCDLHWGQCRWGGGLRQRPMLATAQAQVAAASLESLICPRSVTGVGLNTALLAAGEETGDVASPASQAQEHEIAAGSGDRRVFLALWGPACGREHCRLISTSHLPCYAYPQGVRMRGWVPSANLTPSFVGGFSCAP